MSCLHALPVQVGRKQALLAAYPQVAWHLTLAAAQRGVRGAMLAVAHAYATGAGVWGCILCTKALTHRVHTQHLDVIPATGVLHLVCVSRRIGHHLHIPADWNNTHCQSLIYYAVAMPGILVVVILHICNEDECGPVLNAHFIVGHVHVCHLSAPLSVQAWARACWRRHSPQRQCAGTVRRWRQQTC